MSVIKGSFGELRIEVDVIEVSQLGPKPDKRWRYTDHQGHEHYWAADYPTLEWVIDYTYWCCDCGDEHSEGHWACAICGEEIEPGTVGPLLAREYVSGPTFYYLNDEPISAERARELVGEQQKRPG